MTHYSRAEIGLEPGKGRYRLDPGPVKGIALHWPGDKIRRDTVTEVKTALRAWQQYHMHTKGWSDIAYQIAVDQAGNSYGLRGISYRSAANGDETVNKTHLAFLLVLADGEEPSQAMIATVTRKVAQAQRRFKKTLAVVGHQDVRKDPTACPGSAVMRYVKNRRFEPPKEKK